MPKKIIHHKPHEAVREKSETKDSTKQKMMQLKNTSFDHHSTVKVLDKQAVDDQPIDHSHAMAIPIMTELHFTGNNLLMDEEEDLLAGLNNSHNTETDLIPEDETASLHIDDVLSPAESDLLHALEGTSTNSNNNDHGKLPEPTTLKDSGTGDFSSIQDLLDAGMDIDMGH